LDLPEKLVSALDEAKRITDFGARRRHLQYIGKLMRQLEPETLQAARAALDVQHQGSAEEKQALHQAEQWRDRLIADDAALTEWLAVAQDAQDHGAASVDPQHLRALIRQARKDAQATAPQEHAGAAVRHGKAYREIFQIVKATLTHLA
jgi:ribosome-associated protein